VIGGYFSISEEGGSTDVSSTSLWGNPGGKTSLTVRRSSRNPEWKEYHRRGKGRKGKGARKGVQFRGKHGGREKLVFSIFRTADRRESRRGPKQNFGRLIKREHKTGTAHFRPRNGRIRTTKDEEKIEVRYLSRKGTGLPIGRHEVFCRRKRGRKGRGGKTARLNYFIYREPNFRTG